MNVKPPKDLLRNISDILQRMIDKRIPKLYDARVGWKDGTVTFPDKPNFIKLRWPDDLEFEAINDGVPPALNLKVHVYKDPYNQWTWRAKEPRRSQGSDYSFVTMKPHAPAHTWPNYDAPPIHLRQFLPLRPSVAGMTLSIYAGWIKISNERVYYPGGSVDLSSSRPDAGARYVLFSINANKEIIATNSDLATGIATLEFSSVPDCPDEHKEICAIRLYVGQTEIKDTNNSATDLIDLRFASDDFYFPEAPLDGKQYARQDGNWVEVEDPGLTSAAIGCDVQNNISQDFGNLVFAVETRDNGDFWDALTPGQITINHESAWYLLICFVEWHSYDTAQNREIEIWLNGTTRLAWKDGYANSLIVKAAYLEAGDILTFSSPTDDSGGGIQTLTFQIFLLGSGTGEISAGIPEAPADGNLYGRQNAAWHEIPDPVSEMSNGAIPFVSDGVLKESNSISYDAVNHQLKIGSSEIQSITAPEHTPLILQSEDGTQTNLALQSCTDGDAIVHPSLLFLIAGGTRLSPSAIGALRVMMGISVYGYNGSAYIRGCRVFVESRQSYSTGYAGSTYVIAVTPLDATEVVRMVEVTGEGMKVNGPIETGSGMVVTEAPSNGNLYGRKNEGWELIPGMGDLHPIATSGSYEDLENVPLTFPPSTHNHDNSYEAKGFLTVTDEAAVTAIEVQTIIVSAGALSVDLDGNPVIDFSGLGGIEEAPKDGKQYARKDGSWEEVLTGSSGGISEAPSDGKRYVRKNASWVDMEAFSSTLVTQSEAGTRNTSGSFVSLEGFVQIFRKIKLESVIWTIRNAGTYSLSVMTNSGTEIATGSIVAPGGTTTETIPLAGGSIILKPGGYRFKLSTASATTWRDNGSTQVTKDVFTVYSGTYPGSNGYIPPMGLVYYEEAE